MPSQGLALRLRNMQPYAQLEATLREDLSVSLSQEPGGIRVCYRPCENARPVHLSTRKRKRTIVRFLHFQSLDNGGTSVCRTQAVERPFVQQPAKC